MVQRGGIIESERERGTARQEAEKELGGVRTKLA